MADNPGLPHLIQNEKDLLEVVKIASEGTDSIFIRTLLYGVRKYIGEHRDEISIATYREIERMVTELRHKPISTEDMVLASVGATLSILCLVP
jgi:hypothetical protein